MSKCSGAKVIFFFKSGNDIWNGVSPPELQSDEMGRGVDLKCLGSFIKKNMVGTRFDKVT